MGLGRCRHFFWLGVVFDTVGATVLFTGVFADLLYCDLLLYLGAIIIFFSLLWWAFWYTGNIELTPEEALKRSFHVPSATVVDALRSSVSQRSSFSFCKTTTPFRLIRLGRLRRRLSQRTASLSMTVTGQVEEQLAKEDLGEDGRENVKKSSDAEDFDRGCLGSEPEALQSSEVCAPGPDAGPLCPEAGPPRFVEGASTHLVQSEFISSPMDQPLPPSTLASVVPLAPTSQPLAICISKSLPAVPLSSPSQPLDTLTSKSQTTALVVSQSQPLVPVASPIQLLVPVASQNHPLVPVVPQSHLQVDVASESTFQNLSLDSQAQPQPIQASQAQALATPVSLIGLLSAPSFQPQPVDPQVSPAVQDFQVQYDTPQPPQSSALVQEVALSQSSLAQEILQKPVVQAFKTVPPTGQELSHEVPDTTSPLPESPAPATQAQQSLSPESAFTPTSERNLGSV